MNNFLRYGLFCIFLLVFVSGVCIADEVPSHLIYLEGGTSTSTLDADGMSTITIQDVVPYAHVTYGEKSRLFPLQFLSKLPYPLSAAVVFSDTESESVSLVTISNLSLSDGNTNLTLQASPLKYYEGELLQDFAQNTSVITGKEQMLVTGLYIESKENIPVNEDCPPGCWWSGYFCQDYTRGWICCSYGPCTAQGNDCVC